MSEEMHDKVLTQEDVRLAMQAMPAMREGGGGATEEEIEQVIDEVREWRVGMVLYEFMQEGMIDITVEGGEVKAQMTPEAAVAAAEAAARAGDDD